MTGVRLRFANAVREHVRVRSVRVRSVLPAAVTRVFANSAVREQFVRVHSDSAHPLRRPDIWLQKLSNFVLKDLAILAVAL